MIYPGGRLYQRFAIPQWSASEESCDKLVKQRQGKKKLKKERKNGNA